PMSHGDVLCRLRLQAAPVGRRFETASLHGNQVATNARDSCVRERLLDHSLRLLVVALTEVLMAYATLCVEKVERRPILIAERAPDRKVVVDRDRIVDLHLPRSATDVVQVVLEWEFGCVHADDDQAAVLVLL